MSFVDLVASALVCVIALLILWLQFIDPLGLVPGRRSDSIGADAKSSGNVGESGTAVHGALVSVLAKWKHGASGKLEVALNCDNRAEDTKFIELNSSRYAEVSFRFADVAEKCTLRTRSGDGVPGDVTLHVRSIVYGVRFYQVVMDVAAAKDGVPLLADAAATAVWRALKETQRKEWIFKWNRGGDAKTTR
ncbi:hypothetical protein [Bosea sp. CRIB-10]|uniref:hypothetical protein n=1 Tax=Bosea sp. CRIB-10 TaxID=378404 RepID=UPI000B86F1C0|nr:hypothetical protein [Bosea sp. CRIB-10]